MARQLITHIGVLQLRGFVEDRHDAEIAAPSKACGSAEDAHSWVVETLEKVHGLGVREELVGNITQLTHMFGPAKGWIIPVV